uniref:Uncharacterized protein n=1 Tax=Plectus sambesii TaxID=2011161 RepID=A0A914UUX2_9BILA
MFNSPVLYLTLFVIGLVVADVHTAAFKFENGGEEPSASGRVKRQWNWGGYNSYYGGGYSPYYGGYNNYGWGNGYRGYGGYGRRRSGSWSHERRYWG